MTCLHDRSPGVGWPGLKKGDHDKILMLVNSKYTVQSLRNEITEGIAFITGRTYSSDHVRYDSIVSPSANSK